MDKKNILIIEDEHAHIELIKRAFADQKYAVQFTSAGTLQEAHAFLAENTPDLAIVDLLLPDGRGLDLMADYGEEIPFPVILITSHGDQKIAASAIKQGAMEYVVKSADSLAEMPVIAERVMREWEYITQKKLAERALKESQARIRSIFLAAPIGIGLVTDRILQDVNDRLCDIVAYSREELIGKSARMLYPSQEDYDFVGKEKYAQIEKYGTGTVETRWQRKNGEIINILLSSTPLDKNDHSAEVTFTALDITKSVNANNKLKEYSQKLEEMVAERTRELEEVHEKLVRREKLAVLGQLAGSVGHELRNPLGVISNAVYYLNSITSETDKKTHEYLRMISSEVKNASNIVSDLLNYARTQPSAKDHIDVPKLISGILLKQTPRDNIRVKTEAAPNLPKLYADPSQLSMVFSNLIINAYDAMPQGGVVDIAIEQVKSEPAHEDEQSKKTVHNICISITDNGVGISKENMARIFEPLFSTKPRGIGLGLAICKNLVETNNGTIEVRSQEGKATTFTITFPVMEKV